MFGKPMVNTGPMTQIAAGSRLPRVLLCAIAVSSLAGCSLLPGQNGASSPLSDQYMPVTVNGLPNGLKPKAETLLLTDRNESGSLLETRRRARNAASILQEYLESEGYFAARIRTDYTEDPGGLPRLDVQPGDRFRISEIRFTSEREIDETTSQKLLADISAMPSNAPARTADIEALKRRLVQQLKASGYAFAESGPIDALASREERTLELTYTLVPGPRVQLGEIELTTDADVKPSAILVLKTWDDGNYYSPDKLDRFRTRLRSLSLFDGIGVEVSETPGTNGLHPVTVALSPGKMRSVGAGVTASTIDGIGADAFWEKRNITGAADTIRVDASAATLASELKVTYERPNIGRFGRTLSLEAGLRDEQTDAYDLQGFKVGGEISQPLNPRFTVSAGSYIDATHTEDELGERDQITTSFPLAATYSDVANPLDPQGGRKATLGVEPGVSFGDGMPGYVRVQLSASTYHKVADNLVAAVRSEVGQFLGSNAVPADRRFFAGGGGSVRGYEYQSLSTRDADGDLIGGRGLFNISTELRWRRSDRLGYVFFVDAGAAAESIDEAIAETRSAVGLGVRYYPGFGPIRLDIATPLDRREGDAAVQLYISIGQAF